MDFNVAQDADLLFNSYPNAIESGSFGDPVEGKES
jgi:hypothetical protein